MRPVSLAALAVLGLLLAGCSAPTAPEASSTPAEAPAQEGPPVTLARVEAVVDALLREQGKPYR